MNIGAMMGIVSIMSLLIVGGGQIFAHTQATISSDTAGTVAQKETGGKVLSIKLEKEDGAPVYAVLIENATGNYTVTIDGNNGNVLNVENLDGIDTRDVGDKDNVQNETDNGDLENINTSEQENNTDQDNHEFDGEEDGEP